MMKKNIVTILLVFVGISLYSQQNSQYTQYMYNTMTVNPGYTGSRGFLSVMALYRAQWIGIDGAPKDFNLAGSMPINERGDGIGLVITSDIIGPQTTNNFEAAYAYSLPVGSDLKLGLGINAKGTLLDVDHTKLTAQQQENMVEPLKGKFLPNFGAGGFLYHEKWYAGLSAPSILSTKMYDENINGHVAEERSHFYLVGGYVFDLADNIKFKPATLVKAVLGAPIAYDLSANFLFNDKFSVGTAYRLDSAVSALLGFQITNQLMIGYAYDYDLTDLVKYNSGSHEAFLRFELATDSKGGGKRIVTPRFF